MNTKRSVAAIWWTVAVTAAVLLSGLTLNVRAQRDHGFKQPGAAGNRGGGRDAGLNQPGRVGNNGVVGGSARQTRVADPGLNQPGAVGSRGGVRDPGLNQP